MEYEEENGKPVPPTFHYHRDGRTRSGPGATPRGAGPGPAGKNSGGFSRVRVENP
ncbi:hypothetical protein Kpho02_42080 [Kitasatospora phosalacinea]|uniref:Uncharacterized protein n=1 Tax=Kitasatospora phosalacinea TaxID=2065 RepID=A0A9W6Q8X8_9ACTN|nr:hypothetical protein Kpho02_42080 [Kitasatospora phosalacinea]